MTISIGKQQTRAQETKAVKDALAAAGIPVISVHHGTGTAWAWLTIKLFGAYDAERRNGARAISIIQQVTGRHGAYDGCISIVS